MADRNVYGRDFSENGWRMVDQGSCVWVKVPGTNVSLQIREGQPAAILGAFVADWNAFIEPVRDADSACWTGTNSVGSSNHLSGTACDVCWNSHPFRIANAGFDGGQLNTMREMLKFYEGMVFWGNDWETPKDSMHVQMGYDTYGSENVAKVNDFIRRKIRADGFSTFRRGGDGVKPPVVVSPPVTNEGDRALGVLMDATGVNREKAQSIFGGIVAGLHASQCDNPNRIAMWLGQLGHESGGFVYTEEIASGAAYEGRSDLGNNQSGDGIRFKGRSWIQITGRSNYTRLSKWAFEQGIVPTPDFFVTAPTKLAQTQYAGVGAAWYWVVARSDINALSDKRDLITVTQRINGGQNGIQDRRNRYDRALALGNDLLLLVQDNPNTPATPGDDMAAVPQDQWDRVYQEITKKFPSRSPLRHLGEGAVDTLAGFVLNVDGSEHVEIVRLLAGYGHPPTIALLREVASADPARYPDRQDDAALAEAILAEATAVPSSQATVAAIPAPTYSPLAAALAPEPAPVVPTATTGAVIGQAFDALEALQASGVLNNSESAPLVSALIGVLQTKKTGAAE